jgi:hypothetical protein
LTSNFVCRDEVPIIEAIGAHGRQSQTRFFAGQRESAHEETPMGYLVTIPPHCEVRAHLHGQDQFQVFYPSAGSFYKSTPIDHLILHYVDAYTVYGPFHSADERLEYFTLRARQNELTAYMPEGRDQAAHRKTLQVMVSLPVEWTPSAPRSVSISELITPEADGLAAFTVEAGPHAEITLPDSPGDSPRYVLILDGSVVGTKESGQALRFEPHRTPADNVTAGPEGVRLLALHYPNPPTALREYN